MPRVLELLTPASPSIREAYARCERALAARRPRGRAWWLLRRLLPATEGEDVIALSAWHRTLAEAGTRGAAARRELHEDLEATLAEAPRSALGIALGHTIRRHELPVNLLRGPLEALAREDSQSAFETRDELVAWVRRVAAPEGRLLLRVFGRAGERDEVLADSLACGLRIATWTTRLGRELEGGHLRLPMEELRRFDARLPRPGEPATPELRRATLAQVGWARDWLERGWPLCDELGRWRGRLLAFVLRWHAAGIAALEARGGDALGAPPPAGTLRLVACALAAGASRRPPRF